MQPLALIKARAIGVMTMVGSGATDDKIIAVATNDPEFSEYLEARDLPGHRLLVLKRFFQDYKQLEGKQVQVEEIRPAYAALTVIEQSLARYQKHRDELIKGDGLGHHRRQKTTSSRRSSTKGLCPRPSSAGNFWITNFA